MLGSKAKDVPESFRSAMMAESMALAFDSSVDLGSPAVVAAIAAGMAAIGDPLQKIWIEKNDGKKATYPVEGAIEVMREHRHIRYLTGIARSEVGNSRSGWLTTATAFNNSPNSRTLFFGVPEVHDRERFLPHVALLRSLTSHGVTPQYGFGFYRDYGLGPDYFAIGQVYNTTLNQVAPADWQRIAAWVTERAGAPNKHPTRHRHARGLVLDVFPMNVLTDIHLQQVIEGTSLGHWIAQNTGPDSLLKVSEKCAVWRVPLAEIPSIATRLASAGLLIVSAPGRVH